MSKRSNRRRKRAEAVSRPSHASRPAGSPSPSRRVWRFVAVLVAVGGGLYAIYHYPYAEGSPPQRAFHSFLSAYAHTTATMLNLAGAGVTADGQNISNGFSMRVVKSCDAMEAKCLFVAAVLAFPAAWSRKILGIIFGLTILIAMNLVRLCSLYFIGRHYPDWFDVAHEEVWQLITIAFASGVWLLWAVWVAPTRKAQVPDAPN